MAQQLLSEDPDTAWYMVKNEQKFDALPLFIHTAPSPPPPQPPHTVRFVCISDTHGHVPLHMPPGGDVLIHAGDFTSVGTPSQIERFCDYIATLPHRHKVVVAGNHDVALDVESYEALRVRFRHKERADHAALVARLRAVSTYLKDETCVIEGYNVHGSPWQPEFCDWAFNLPRGEACRRVWRQIPTATDILVTHGPPLGRGDECLPSGNRAGCVDLLREVQTRVKPVAHVFGHIHEGYGVSSDGVTLYVNASTCNLRYRPDNRPIVFDLPQKRE